MIDATHQINAVRRQVGSRTLEAGEGRTLTISQAYDAPIDDVWDACTNADRIPRWLMPVTGDLRLGGHYQLVGNAGGTVTSCDPPNAFAATWEYGEEISWIEVRLTRESAERTRLEIEHIADVGNEKWAEFGPGAMGVGWDMMVLGLALHLSSGAANDPEESMAWAMSEDGAKFMMQSNDVWRDANIDAGADRAAAEEAAARTIAAYTAPPEEI
jgi:uncharacterized protein YndB with AHSA1/START domain